MNRPSLPHWPRLMPARLACLYVGWSETGFRERVGELWPEPIRIGGKLLWDRVAIDEVVDRLSANGAASPVSLRERVREICKVDAR